MNDQVSKIDQKILQLKKRKEKLQTHQAVLFLKESQKILGEKFSSELAIHVLSHAWKASSDQQKKEWEKEVNISVQEKDDDGGNKEKDSFRKSSQSNREKNQQYSTENTEI